MDPWRFDRLSLAFATPASRRALVKGLAGAAGAGLLSRLALGGVAAAPGKPKQLKKPKRCRAGHSEMVPCGNDCCAEGAVCVEPFGGCAPSDATPCGDGFCPVGQACVAGLCQAVDPCMGVTCTASSCNGGQCQYDPVPNCCPPDPDCAAPQLPNPANACACVCPDAAPIGTFSITSEGVTSAARTTRALPPSTT